MAGRSLPADVLSVDNGDTDGRRQGGLRGGEAGKLNDTAGRSSLLLPSEVSRRSKARTAAPCGRRSQSILKTNI
jgi:hypothetical protein